MASGVSEDELLARALQAAEQGPNPYLHSHFYAEDSFSEDDDADYNHTTNRPKKKPKRKAIHRSTSVANVSKNAPKPRQKSPSVSITAEPTQPKKTGTGQRGRKKKVDSQPAEESPPTNSSDLASQVKADEQNEKDLDQHDTLSQIQLQVLGESMPHHTGSGKTDAGADQKQSPVDNGTRTDNPFRKADSIETIGDKVISTNSEDGRFRRGQWSAEEEQLFIYSLENYGRDWKRMQELITTRDHRSIRSHAQKHLLRLQRRGLPLPDKVRESGEGYTLSGKLLDLDPSTPRVSKAPQATHSHEDENDSASDIDSPGEPIKQSCRNGPNEQKAIASISPHTSPAKGRKRSAEKQRTGDKHGLDDAAAYQVAYPIQRERRKRQATNIGNLGYMSFADPLQMLPCWPFSGNPGGNQPGCQPFTMNVHVDALILADFHAHLSTSEIIGFLAGKWDPESRHIEVFESYPCKSLDVEQDNVNVEMDPTSAHEVREAITDAGLSVVGWYHSHPTFQPDPSIRDVENQTCYQHLCRDERNDTEPFVGLIVGPYDSRLPSCQSATNWFYVGTAYENKGRPMALEYDVLETRHDKKRLLPRMIELQRNHALYPKSLDLGELWPRLLPVLRHPSENHELKQITRGEKLYWSISSRMPNNESSIEFLTSIQSLVGLGVECLEKPSEKPEEV
eukprot:TRINITY_DN4039_c0_g2_i6.p1 TRINITY_DN4039_c0_g2~~TRINITY_DN4039_c0_g2_i6.p1  ORF type:complete len:679 (+),score=109.33 TRINITY_DN4039_c0_g2_i6:158-2194(+)